MRIELEVNAVGEFTEEELKDFIQFEVMGGGISQYNPFVDEDETAEIVDVDIY